MISSMNLLLKICALQLLVLGLVFKTYMGIKLGKRKRTHIYDEDNPMLQNNLLIKEKKRVI